MTSLGLMLALAAADIQSRRIFYLLRSVAPGLFFWRTHYRDPGNGFMAPPPPDEDPPIFSRIFFQRDPLAEFGSISPVQRANFDERLIEDGPAVEDIIRQLPVPDPQKGAQTPRALSWATRRPTR